MHKQQQQQAQRMVCCCLIKQMHGMLLSNHMPACTLPKCPLLLPGCDMQQQRTHRL